MSLQQLGSVLDTTCLVLSLGSQIPQIVAMLRSGNVAGLSLNAYFIELYS